MLDMDDIAREEFWKLNGDIANEYPGDIKRTFPMSGYYSYTDTYRKRRGQKINRTRLELGISEKIVKVQVLNIGLEM